MEELVLTPIADAFMQVGVFVAAMIAVFGVLQWRFGERLTQLLASRWRSAPLVGALLGVTPGCGGAILVIPLYLRGTVSFGTVCAALVATMGDASFVILAAAPRFGLALHAGLLVTGVVTGYAVDAIGWQPARTRLAGPAASTVGAAEAMPPLRRLGEVHLPVAAVLFWGLAAAGLAVAAPVLFQVVDSAVLAGVDAYLLLGVAGTVACGAVVASSGGGFGDDTVESIRAKQQSLRAVASQGARETAFVTTWVAAAYLVTAWVMVGAGVDLTGVAGIAGLGGVALGALVGLVPGCAVQLVLAGLYVSGGVPVPTLVANAVSQDGDALFPLLTVDRRAAAAVTAITTVPAMLIGTVVWLYLRT